MPAINRVKELEKKVSDLEGVNAGLTEINEQLTDECVVKEGELQSLKNESFVRSQQDLGECNQVLMQNGAGGSGDDHKTR